MRSVVPNCSRDQELEEDEEEEEIRSRSINWSCRRWLQLQLGQIGIDVSSNCSKVCFLGLLILISLSVTLKSIQSIKFETKLSKLWIEEGSKLEFELNYIKSITNEDVDSFSTTSSSSLVIQSPSIDGANILSSSSLLYHYQVMKIATEISVDLFDVTWKLKDLCYSPSFPSFEEHFVEKIMSNLLPCVIMTPLDCFWEGSKILGPEFPIYSPGLPLNLKWSNLNPASLINLMSKVTSHDSSPTGFGFMPVAANQEQDVNKQNGGRSSSFPFSFIQEMVTRAGITTGYQEKLCLDPKDPLCPISSPNHGSTSAPDPSLIGATLTGGCHGFATKLMHWPEDLIIGGIKKNKTGHIIKASALQSVIQLMGEQEFYDFWSDDYKVHNINWSLDKAKLVLESWQRKLNQEVSKATGITTSPVTGSKFGSSKSDLQEEELLAELIQEEEIVIPNSKKYQISLFTSTLLSDIMNNFSSIDYKLVAGSILILLIFSSLICYNSKCILIVILASGLLIMSTIAALGACALIGFTFNPLTTLIAPFVTIGISMQSLFYMLKTYLDQVSQSRLQSRLQNKNNNKSNQDQVIISQTLQLSGSDILITNCSIIISFLSSAIIPIPALRSFVTQSALMITFHLISLIIIFPAILTFDLRRIKNQQKNLLSCFKNQVNNQHHVEDGDQENDDEDDEDESDEIASRLYHQRSPQVLPQVSPQVLPQVIPKYSAASKNVNCIINQLKDTCPIHSSNCVTTPAGIHKGGHKVKFSPVNNTMCTCTLNNVTLNIQSNVTLSAPVKNVTLNNHQEDQITRRRRKNEEEESMLSLDRFVERIYAPLLISKSIKISVIIIFIISIMITATGIPKVKDGLELTDIVPRNTIEHKFLSDQKNYFSFFNIFAVTMGNFEYPTNQKLLYDYHSSFNRIGKIIKNDDGGLPEFWLSYFRDWLINLQAAFDADHRAGLITQETWFNNASDSGILAYKLLVQTGRTDYPIDKSLINKIRLVDKNGIINPKAFYVYLTAWSSIDSLTYSSCGANLKPEPRVWEHVARDYELKIPKSQPITFAQMPFYLNRMNTTESIVKTIQEIRSICDKFESRGLPNFPTGIPITFWEQYLHLRFYLMLGIIIALSLIWLILSIYLNDCFISSLITILILIMSGQIFGLMGLLQIRLSAVSAVILIMSLGICTLFYIPITLKYLSKDGNKNERLIYASNKTMTAMLSGICVTCLSFATTLYSPFDFLRYSFHILISNLLLGSIYGLIVFPILISIINPRFQELILMEIKPPNNLIAQSPITHLSTASVVHSPIRMKKKQRKHSSSSNSRRLKNISSNNQAAIRVPSNVSLSTISEE